MNTGSNNASEMVRVLVVEDNLDDSDLLVRQLTKNNFNGSVMVIPDGQQAWDFLTSELSCIDLIALFLDVNLPSFSGLELLRRVRANGQLRDIPVFVMSSSMRPEVEGECVDLGAETISKPVPYTAFAKKVADFFHARSPGQRDGTPEYLTQAV